MFTHSSYSLASHSTLLSVSTVVLTIYKLDADSRYTCSRKLRAPALWCHEHSEGTTPGARGLLKQLDANSMVTMYALLLAYIVTMELASNYFRVRDKVNKQCRFVVDLVVYMYILFCFLLVLVGLIFSVSIVNTVEVYYQI